MWEYWSVKTATKIVKSTKDYEGIKNTQLFHDKELVYRKR